MIGSLISGALAIGSSIYGGIQASRAAKQAKAGVEQQKKDNQNWYDRRYNEDATQRADAQRMLQLTQQAIKDRNKAASGSQAVMGGTEESVAATKQANAQAMADTASQIAASGAARKDAIENQYQAVQQGLNGQLNNIEMQRAQNIANATAGAVKAAGALGAGINGLDGGKLKTQNTAGLLQDEEYDDLTKRIGGLM